MAAKTPAAPAKAAAAPAKATSPPAAAAKAPAAGAAPAAAGAAKENSWTPFVKLLMGIGKDNKHDSAKTGVQTAGIFGSAGSTYWVDPGWAGTKLGVDEETKEVITVPKVPAVDEIKKLWEGLQAAVKDNRNNPLCSGGIHFGGRKFMFSKVVDVQGKEAKDGTHTCIIGRCKSSSIVLTPNAKSFTALITAQNFPVGNITTHCFVATSLKKSAQ